MPIFSAFLTVLLFTTYIKFISYEGHLCQSLNLSLSRESRKTDGTFIHYIDYDFSLKVKC